MKKQLQNLLANLARRILAKHKPTVIGITGSVGKTSAKEAIYLLVSQKFSTRKSNKNFNNEFGLPLTIIGSDSPGRNIFSWILVILKAIAFIVFPLAYPKVLVLEMGIDRVGDMDYLLSIAKPHISVLTGIGVSHYEFFKDEATIAREKGKIAEILSADDFFIVNADNSTAMAQRARTKAKSISYGMSAGATVQVREFSEHVAFDGVYTDLLVSAGDEEIQAQIKAVGVPHVSSVLAAIAVCQACGVEQSLIVQGLRQYKPFPGRLSIIPGVKKSIIIDDTYNAAPDSVREALAVLANSPATSKIIILGDMLELGTLSDSAHREVGARVAAIAPDYFITIGPSGKIMAASAKEAGLASSRILSFDTSDEAKSAIAQYIQPGTILLIKGSQGVRLEKITKELMNEPMRAGELLCRQYGKWLEG